MLEAAKRDPSCALQTAKWPQETDGRLQVLHGEREMVNAMHCVADYERAVGMGYPRHSMPPRLYEEAPTTFEGG